MIGTLKSGYIFTQIANDPDNLEHLHRVQKLNKLVSLFNQSDDLTTPEMLDAMPAHYKAARSLYFPTEEEETKWNSINQALFKTLSLTEEQKKYARAQFDKGKNELDTTLMALFSRELPLDEGINTALFEAYRKEFDEFMKGALTIYLEKLPKLWNRPERDVLEQKKKLMVYKRPICFQMQDGMKSHPLREPLIKYAGALNEIYKDHRGYNVWEEPKG